MGELAESLCRVGTFHLILDKRGQSLRWGTGVPDDRFRLMRSEAGRAKKKISHGCATADPVVTHYKDFSVTTFPRPFVKLEGFSVEPARAGLLVVFEPKPEPLKLSDLLGVCIS